SPAGTAGSAHLDGIDFAGTTGSAQTMSNALAQKLGHKHSVKDNAWFVGVTPRRNPELVVAVLFEGGEHGQFAARLAAQVVKAYVLKQRAKETKMAAAAKDNSVELAGFWGIPDPDGHGGDGMRGARIHVDLDATKAPVAAAVIH
ncbi:MAG: penicillin-binding transpeptidase domain-containing protein, partial [Terriglobales bacterium]